MGKKRTTKTVILQFVVVFAVIVFLFLSFDSGRSFIKVEDIYSPDFTLGIVPFNAAQAYAESSGAKLEYYDDFFAACSALAAGKIDGFADDAVLLARYADSNPSLTFVTDDFGVTEFCGIMRQSDSELYYSVNKYLTSVSNPHSGDLSRMRSTWLYGVDPSMPDIERPYSPSGTLRIITTAAVEPYSYVGEDGQLMGLEIELGMRIASSLGMDWEFIVVDSGAVINSLYSGKGDIILSCFTESDETGDELLYTTPYASVNTGVLVQSSRLFGMPEVDDEPIWERTIDSFLNSFIVQSRWKLILKGIGVTLLISVTSFVLANIIGDRLCVAMRFGSKVGRRLSGGFIKLMNGVPIVVLLMLLYYVVFRRIDLPAIAVSIIGFSLCCGAELETIFEVGIESVGKGQIEAADSIGFTSAQIFRLIILPQAAQRIFGLYKNALVSLIKSTSVVGYIAVMDVTKVTDLIRSRTYAPFFPLICSTVLYYILTRLVLFAFRQIEIRFDIERKKRTIKGVRLG